MVQPLPRMGITPCLTPHMVPYITNRGAPLIGLEALSLQGIPIEDVLLTRESEKDMADLAGNAMTTTVVGAAIVSALLVAKKAILAGPPKDDSDDDDDDGQMTNSAMR